MKARSPNKRVRPSGDGGGAGSTIFQETLHLISISEMRDSIREGMAGQLDKSSTKPGWWAGPSLTRSKPTRTPGDFT